MRDVFVVGVGMTRFSKYPDRSIKYLTCVALERSLSDARLNRQDIEAAWFSNSVWGFFSGQHGIRGQVALREGGIEGIPISNVENAGAGGAIAFHLAWLGVASGLHGYCVLAIGVEKVYHEDKEKMAADPSPAATISTGWTSPVTSSLATTAGAATELDGAASPKADAIPGAAIIGSTLYMGLPPRNSGPGAGFDAEHPSHGSPRQWIFRDRLKVHPHPVSAAVAAPLNG